MLRGYNYVLGCGISESRRLPFLYLLVGFCVLSLSLSISLYVHICVICVYVTFVSIPRTGYARRRRACGGVDPQNRCHSGLVLAAIPHGTRTFVGGIMATAQHETPNVNRAYVKAGPTVPGFKTRKKTLGSRARLPSPETGLFALLHKQLSCKTTPRFPPLLPHLQQDDHVQL